VEGNVSVLSYFKTKPQFYKHLSI